MKRKYTGTELLEATRLGLIEDGSRFKCKNFKDLIFIYSESFLSDEDDDFRNYWIMENGISVDGCLADITSGLNLDNLIFKLASHKKLKQIIEQHFCKHEWDSLDLPHLIKLRCIKCEKEVVYSPYWDDSDE